VAASSHLHLLDAVASLAHVDGPQACADAEDAPTMKEAQCTVLAMTDGFLRPPLHFASFIKHGGMMHGPNAAAHTGLSNADHMRCQISMASRCTYMATPTARTS
jgi:hypothetical protein